MESQSFSVGVNANISGFERGFNNAIGLLNRFATQVTTSGGQVARAVSQINGGNYAPLQRGLASVSDAFNRIAERAKYAGFQVAYYATNANSLLTDAYSRSDQEQKKFDAGLGRLGSNLQSAGRSMSTYFTAPLIAAGLAAFGTYAKIDSLNRALTVIEGPTGNVAARFKELREVAELPGLSLENAIKGDVRLRAVGLSAKLSKEALLEFGNVIAMTGGGGAELGQITTQLSQMAAKGKVVSQDLKPIIEAAPAVSRSILKLFGTISSDEIADKLAATGKTSTDFIALLTSEMSKLERVSGGPKNALENLQDSLQIASYEFVGAADKTLNLTGRLNGLGTFVNSVSERFKEMSPGTQTAILSLVGLTAAAGPLALGMGTLINLIPTITTGFKAMKTAMLAIGSPIGIIVGAVAVVGSLAYALYRFNETATATVDQSKLLAGVNKEVSTQIGAETTNLQSLIAVAKDETISKQARQAAIEKINAIAPQYLGNITLDTINTNAATAAIARYTNVLSLKAKAQVYAQRQAESMANAEKAAATSAKEFADSWGDTFAAGVKSIVVGGGVVAPEVYQKEKGAERQKAAKAGFKAEAKFYQDKLLEVNKELAKTEIKPPKVAVKPSIDFTKVGQDSAIKKAKEEMKSLAEQIQSGNLAGQDTSALQARWNQLSTEIDRATESTKKHQAAAQSSKEYTELMLVESIYKRLITEQQKYAAANTMAPTGLLNNIETFKARIEEIKNSLVRTKIDLPVHVHPDGQIDGQIQRKPKFEGANVAGEISYRRTGIPLPTLPQIAQRLDLKINTVLVGEDLKTQIDRAFAGMPSFMKGTSAKVKKEIDDAVANGGMLDGFKTLSEAFASAKEQLAHDSVSVLTSIGDAIGKGENPLAAALGTILDILGGYLIQLGEALLFSSATLLAAAPLSLGITLAPGLGQQLAGAGLIVGGAAVKALGHHKFARGGVVDSPTWGLMGEYPGAQHNKEIITPQRLMSQVVATELQKNAFREPVRTASANRMVEKVPYFVTIGAKIGELTAEIRRHQEGLDDFNGD